MRSRRGYEASAPTKTDPVISMIRTTDTQMRRTLGERGDVIEQDGSICLVMLKHTVLGVRCQSQ